MATSASWQPPPEVIARGNAARVWETQGSVIDPALMDPANPGHIRAGAVVQMRPTPAVVAFRDWVVRNFPGFSSGGLGRSQARSESTARRADANGNYHRDVHEEARAIDFMVRDIASAEGEALANWLLANAEAIGVQGIVWNRASWYPTRTPRTAPRFQSGYTGESEHRDHVHAELSEGAAARTPELMRAVLDSLPRSLPAESSSSVGGWLALALAAGGAYAGYRWQKGRRR
jgi:hypothetical protein